MARAAIISLLRRLLVPLDADQITELATTIHGVTTEAYRQAIDREVAKLGLRASGPLDPFIDAVLASNAHLSARQISDTFLRHYQAAAARGDDLSAWQRQYGEDRGDLVWRYELSRADGNAVQTYYTRNQLTGTAHVEPGVASIPDVCMDLIGMGEIPVDEAMLYELPAHQRCPHLWVVTPAPPGGPNGSSAPGGLANGGAPGAGSAATADANPPLEDLMLTLWTAGLLLALADDDNDESTGDDQ